MEQRSFEAIDLRSDTVTQPSPAMREAMARAEVGDDVFDEDPTVRELEARAARLTGKEAALFVPSGCMANLIVQMVHVRRGDEVICGRDAHIVLHEVGSGAAIAGAQYDVAPTERIDADFVAARIRKATFHEPGTGLVWMENTHNMAGGRTTSVEETAAIAEVCRSAAVPLHVDGARIFNAAAALGVSVRELAAPADSISFCLSKGLGCPVGSMLCGPPGFRVQAHRFRKMLGGGMRQVGILAAAGLFALERNVERLREDHARARRLAAALAGTPGLTVRRDETETNIVIARLENGEADAEPFVNRCATLGVLFLALDRTRVRFVTHLQVDDAQIDKAAEVIRSEV